MKRENILIEADELLKKIDNGNIRRTRNPERVKDINPG